MGLDMYLEKRIYIGANYKHNKIEGNINLTRNGKIIDVQLNKVKEIIEEAGYWRKANAIHQWFVDKIQEGEDNCAEYYVSYEQLQELKKLCQEVLLDKTKAEELLPSKSGFFFGNTEYNEGYFQDLEDTIKIIDSLDENFDYYYSSSW